MGPDFWIMMAILLVAATSFEGWRYWLFKRFEARADRYVRRSHLVRKLHFAVSVSRNGGYWADRGEVCRRYRTTNGGPLIKQYKTAYRWQSA